MAQNKIISPNELKVGDIYLYKFVPESPCIWLGDNKYLDVCGGKIYENFGYHNTVMLVSSFSDNYRREDYPANFMAFKF